MTSKIFESLKGIFTKKSSDEIDMDGFINIMEEAKEKVEQDLVNGNRSGAIKYTMKALKYLDGAQKKFLQPSFMKNYGAYEPRIKQLRRDYDRMIREKELTGDLNGYEPLDGVNIMNSTSQPI